MILKKRQKIAVIHIARTECGLSDTNYRELLRSCAGVDSASEMTREDQFQSVMDAFRQLGYSPLRKASHDRMSGRQEAYIRGLWAEKARNQTEDAMNAFIRRITGKEELSLLNRREAAGVISALRAMKHEGI